MRRTRGRGRPRSANSRSPPSRHAEVVQLVERERHDHRLAAEPSHVDLREAVRCRGSRCGRRARRAGSAARDRSRLDVAVLGTQVDPHRVAGREAVHRQARARRRRRGSGRRPTHCALEHVDLAQEVGDERRRRALVDVLRRADLLDRAVVHHDDAVRHRQRLLLVVRDHDRRDLERAAAARGSRRAAARAPWRRAPTAARRAAAATATSPARARARPAAAGRRTSAPGTWRPRRAGRRASAAPSRARRISARRVRRLTRP